jgi:hypothetical protein
VATGVITVATSAANGDLYKLDGHLQTSAQGHAGLVLGFGAFNPAFQG